MPRRRRPDEPMDSLDLLLDTICNTFGGVLFMAMLVSLLSGRRAETPTNAEAEARLALGTLGTIEARERSLADSAARAAEARAARARADDEVRQDANRLGWTADKTTNVVVSLAPRATVVDEALNVRSVLAKLAQQAHARSTDLAKATDEFARRQAEITIARTAAAEKAKRSGVTLRLPAAHESDKRQNVAFVSGGRLYAGVYPDEGFRQGGRLFRGTTHGGGDKRVVPTNLPDHLGSAVVQSADEAQAAIRDQGVAALDADTEYVMFAVWPDSYDAFRHLRDATSARGVGYGLILLENGEAVGFGQTRGYEQ